MEAEGHCRVIIFTGRGAPVAATLTATAASVLVTMDQLLYTTYGRMTSVLTDSYLGLSDSFLVRFRGIRQTGHGVNAVFIRFTTAHSLWNTPLARTRTRTVYGPTTEGEGGGAL